jgi:hypothetical protein
MFRMKISLTLVIAVALTTHFGDMEMVPGGGFFVAKHFMSNQGAYQTSNPKADNYITIQSSNPDAKFVVDTRPMGGMHGGFRGATPGLFFRLEEGVLTRRDTVTITYGDRSGGSKGFKVQTFSNDALPLPLYVDLQGKRELLTLPIQTYKVGGGPVYGVHGFAPSIVKTSEPFTVSVRSEDLYRNRASGDIPAYEVLVNGEPFSSIASDDHLSHPGYSTPLPGGLAQPGGLAAVLAPEKTRDAIFSAMKDLAAYATTGQRMILDFRVNLWLRTRGSRKNAVLPTTKIRFKLTDLQKGDFQ